ncbi:hypothetical protein OS242_06995 [Tumebacillus sp. DT12]|uniref:Uncharacterized protein n=1 Tax=Tumebacillus lacus TaxID=2995335 RepID=A0ABT3X1Q7_9BACL|nr:hypothetical protein [Tumebacillus lacus]MCX7569707.1 hypothetical protein [Tumebacillus lacus]
MKKRTKALLIFILLIVLVLVLVASCFGGKKPPVGTHEVTQAVYEQKDDDYELNLKQYGEYDVKKLTVVEKAGQSPMLLEIKADGTHTLTVASKNDIIIDQGSSSSLKKKKKKK